MNINYKLKKLAKDFNLNYDYKKLKYLECSKEEILIRIFLSDCRDPVFVKYKNRVKALNEFINSKDFKNQLKNPQACVIHKEEIKIEYNLIKNISDKKLKQKITSFYNKIKKKIGRNEKLILIWKTKNKNSLYNKVLLHELIHGLLENNKIRLKSWKWNEGLVTYLTYHALGKKKILKKHKSEDKMWKTYDNYAIKWDELFKNVNVSVEKRNIILNKIN